MMKLKSKNIKQRFIQCLTSLCAGEGLRVRFLFTLVTLFTLFSCSVTKQISKQANTFLLKDSAISTGHIGICIYEPATGKYWYNYQAEQFFIPASNTKLFSLYAGMKYLGDSLPGIKVLEFKDRIVLQPTGDPTLLHPDFKNQPVLNYLSNTKKSLWGSDASWKETAWGSGWSWNDYEASYMAERSALPIYGNIVRFKGTKNSIQFFPKGAVTFSQFPIYSKDGATGFIDNANRDFKENIFKIGMDGKKESEVEISFITSSELAFKLLSDTLKKVIISPNTAPPVDYESDKLKTFIIHSQPSDSLFTIMMHRSDNFFAEQTLLMASNEKLGYMSDGKMIEHILKNDLTDIPQQPKWIDGSGLSRYNLFTPKDFVYILQKLKNDFSFERIKMILPTGGTGTLSSLYKKDSGYIFAKTGSLSNNSALSGYLITKNNRLLLFSILANNFITSATPVRKAVEKFLSNIRQRY